MIEVDDEIARRLEAAALVGVDIDLRAPRLTGHSLGVHDIAVAEIAGLVESREPARRRHGDGGDARRACRREAEPVEFREGGARPEAQAPEENRSDVPLGDRIGW